MYLLVNLGGWVFPHDYATAAWERDRIARPYVWTFCPFCGATLPLRRFLSPPPHAEEDDCA